MFTQIKSYFFCYGFGGLLLLMLSTQCFGNITLKKTYIAMNVRGQIASTFYPVLIDKHNIPYLPLYDIAQKWLDMRVKCNKTLSYCQLVLNSQHKIYWLNAATWQLGEPEKKSIELPNNVLVKRQHQLWLRYDYWQRWLPLKVIWSLEQYKIFLRPAYQSPAELALQRKIELANNTRKQKLAEQIAAMHAIEPNKRINAQARYRLNWANPLMNNQTVNTQYDATVDVLKGTLKATGSLFNSTTETANSPIFWNYALSRPGKFRLLQIGDAFFNGSLLLPSFNLHNGMVFERLKQAGAHPGFVYQNYAIPGTDVDIYRNDVLIGITTANANGVYDINDPDAVAGDNYTFHLYFKDGHEKTVHVQMAEDDQSLIGKGQWDTDFEIGSMREISLSPFNNSQTTSGPFAHNGWRYGLTHDMTIGVDAYRFPALIQHGGLGASIDWQTSATLNNLFETVGYNGNTDYALMSNYSGLNHQSIRFRLQDINPSSPLKIFNQTPLFDDVPFASIYPSVTRYWLLKDTIGLGNWQLTPEYKYSNAGDLYGVNAIGSLGQHLSLSMSSGIARPNFTGNTGFAETTAFYSLNTHNLIQFSRTWFQTQGQTSLSYRYQSLQEIGWDLSLGMVKPDHGDYDPEASIQWRLNKDIATSLNADQHSVTLQVSLLGLFAMQPGPTDYDNFGTGTVTGQLFAAPLHPGDKPTPIANAIVSVGGKQVHTDKQGKYIVTGIPTATRVQLSVLPSSLDASLMPDKKVTIIRLRPSTLVSYNPKLDWDAGMDGIVNHGNKPIPPGTEIEVVKSKQGSVIAEARVEPNGFFILNKLTKGHYYLKIKGSPSQLTAFTIKQDSHWISNEQVLWR